jgi:hypothetical protein
MSDMRSPTKDSSALLRIHLEEAQRKRFKVKQVATFSSSSAVVYVPPAPQPICVCKKCQNILGELGR